MNRKNLGYQFETEFGRWLSKRHPFVIKLPDTRSLRSKAKSIEVASNKTFQELTGTKTPADFWSVQNSYSHLWECKHTMQESLPFDRIAPHQRMSLESHANAGGNSYIVVGHKNKTAYCLTYNSWKQLQQRFETKGRKSVPMEWIKHLSFCKLERRTPSQLEGEDKARYVEVSQWD